MMKCGFVPILNSRGDTRRNENANKTEKDSRMKELKKKAGALIETFKKDRYIFGMDRLDRIGTIIRDLGDRVHLVTSLQERDPQNFETLAAAIAQAGLQVVGHSPSARPNSPQQDVFRIAEAILSAKPDLVLAATGGSGIDATKAAIVLAKLGGTLDDYFGVGKVTETSRSQRKALLPFVAVQTASGSAAHLTKYANITELRSFQKKLIIDEAVVPTRSLFDYGLTRTMSRSFTCDGAFDGLSHCLEVYYGAQPESYPLIEEIALTGIELILAYLEDALADPDDREAREALGMATDLGGYAIMVGGTNGAHLTSFSLVDILSHGRACAILNPYYTILFAPAIRDQLRKLIELFARYDLIRDEDLGTEGDNLGKAVALGLITLSRRTGFPTTLGEIEGFAPAHITKALQAAKDPQLASKLQNMPVPMTAESVDIHMRLVLEAAITGDITRIKTLDP